MYENNDLNFALRVANLKHIIVPNFVSIKTASKLYQANFPQKHRCLYYFEYFKGSQKVYALRTLKTFALEHGYKNNLDKVIQNHKYFAAPTLQDLMSEFSCIKIQNSECSPVLTSFVDKSKKQMFRAFISDTNNDPLLIEKNKIFIHPIPVEAMAALYLYCTNQRLFEHSSLLGLTNYSNK